ncbi:MAG: rRNA maturation RNase YbeY [Clostridiales bacterium]|jgi:probable rRNA maturation factor|nr:rRNA maturation RNase YbeY [Clostridiales bacterium]
MIKVVTEAENPIFSRVAAAAFARLNLAGDPSVEVVIASEDEIRALNAGARGTDAVTDVLSFPMTDGAGPFTKAAYPFDYDGESDSVNIGSVVICDSRAAAQAALYGHSVERETGYLFLHGLLHLLGYDHADQAAKKRMRTAEDAVLADAGLLRPDAADEKLLLTKEDKP